MAKSKDKDKKFFQGKRYEVVHVTRRALRNGDRLQIVLEAPYDRAEALKATDIDARTVEVSLIESDELPPQLDGIGDGGE